MDRELRKQKELLDKSSDSGSEASRVASRSRSTSESRAGSRTGDTYSQQMDEEPTIIYTTDGRM